MGLGLFPEIVKITHPQYERVQGMVKVWRIRDFGSPQVVRDGSKQRSRSEDGGAGEQVGQNGSEIETIKGQAEAQDLRPGMMLVGINGQSILRQRNTWRETLLRVSNARRPVVLTFRDVPTGIGYAPPNADSTISEKGTMDGNLISETPGTPGSMLRGSRDVEYGLSTPNAGADFVDMVHAGQISLSENRRRTWIHPAGSALAPSEADEFATKSYGTYHRDQLSRAADRRRHYARVVCRLAKETGKEAAKKCNSCFYLVHLIAVQMSRFPAALEISLCLGFACNAASAGSMRLDTFDRSAVIRRTGPSPRIPDIEQVGFVHAIAFSRILFCPLPTPGWVLLVFLWSPSHANHISLVSF